MKRRSVVMLVAISMVMSFAMGIAYSINLGSVLKAGAIVVVIDKFGGQIDNFVNKLTFNNNLSSRQDTKVVPILSLGSGGYVGAAQVIGNRTDVAKCKAVVQIEGNGFFGRSLRAKALVPVESNSTKNVKRVEGVGVSAIIDIKL